MDKEIIEKEAIDFESLLKQVLCEAGDIITYKSYQQITKTGAVTEVHSVVSSINPDAVGTKVYNVQYGNTYEVDRITSDRIIKIV